jgi:tRNA(Ile)-lysidine synthase
MKNLETIFNTLEGQSKVAIAVSGGADSMALVLLAKQWADANKSQIVALTVDHCLRPESAAEAVLVHKWLKGRKIEHHILQWQDHKKTSNIQSEARQARYKLMTDFCKKNNITILLVAHNKEDQAETVLLRIMRGSGVDGLAGMAAETEISDIKVLRPLLATPKKYLREFLNEQGQEWVEDPSNQNPKYERVKIRQFIESSADSSLLIDRLFDTAKNMQRSRSYIETMVAKDFAETAEIKPEGYAIISRKKFLNLHSEAAYRILAKLIKNIGGDYYKPRFEKLEKLYAQILSNPSLSGVTLGGCNIYSYKNNLNIIREISAVEANINIEQFCEIIWDNRFKCQLADTQFSDLKIGALGQNGLKQVLEKTPDLPLGVLPKKIIYTLPALRNLEKILAVPHICYYASDELKQQVSLIFLY